MHRLLVVATLALAFPGYAAATTYYVSPSGSDGASGTTAAAAWRTVGRVNDQHLVAGDTVLFAGGSTFGDSTLMPDGSGDASAPIRFASFGGGQATISNRQGAVWFSGAAYLDFDNLSLTTAGSDSGVFAGSGGGASAHITLENSNVSNTAGAGIIAPNHDDASWTISNTTVSHTGDSGLILLGRGHTVTHCRITDTGGNASISYGKHGVYSKGPDQTISYNDISNDHSGQAISIRFHGTRVFGNSIHDTSAGIGFFDYDTVAAPQGASYVYNNTFRNIGDWGFYYDSQLDPNGKAPTVNIILTSNTGSFATGAVPVSIAPGMTGNVTLVTNTFGGKAPLPLPKTAAKKRLIASAKH